MVEQIMMQPLRSGSHAVNARIPDDGGEDGDVAHSGCAHLIDQASFTKPGDVWGERVDRIMSDR